MPGALQKKARLAPGLFFTAYRRIDACGEGRLLLFDQLGTTVTGAAVGRVVAVNWTAFAITVRASQTRGINALAGQELMHDFGAALGKASLRSRHLMGPKSL